MAIPKGTRSPRAGRGPALATMAFLSMVITSRPAAAATLTLGPFLQLVDEASILVAWRTAEPADSAVEHGLDASYGQRDSDPGKVTSHALLLTDLTPGTLYHYRVLGDGVPLSEDRTFRTAPGFLTPRDPFRFIALGDTGLGGPPQIDVAAQVALSAPAIGLHIGDLVYPSLNEAGLKAKYFDMYRETISRAAVYVALGNKDVETDGGSLVLDSFYLPEKSPLPERCYSFVYGNALFVALDTNGDLSASGKQIAWLDGELSRSDRMWKIVFFHHAIYSSTPPDLATLADRASLEPLLDRHRVDLVIQGHNHYYERTYPIQDGANASAADDPNYTDPGGPIYVVTGGGGGTLATAVPDSHSARYASVYEHLRVDVGAYRLTLAAVDRQGAVFDAMTITRSDAPPARPSGLTARAGDGKVELRWDANSEADLRGYDVHRASSPEGPYAKVTADPLPGTSFTDTGLADGQVYCYVVEAVDNGGKRSEPSAAVCQVPREEPAVFKRSDTDGDGEVNLTDAVSLLGFLFLGTEAPVCPDAADVDDDGTLALTDGVVSLSWQFLGGEEPAAPGPFACGPDVTPSAELSAPCNYPEASCR